MVKRTDSNLQRLKRHKRVRGKISGTAERPRLAVYRSNANISAQIIDDVKGVTLVSASTYEKDFEGTGSNKEAARKVGNTLAKRAMEKAFPPSYLTAVATFITDAYRNSRKAPEKAA